MSKIEEKIIDRYKKHITKLIKRKYFLLSEQEAKNKKFYLEKKSNTPENIAKIQKEIYANYSEIIESEIEIRVEQFVNSEKFKKSIESQSKLEKRKLSYKNLKQYQDFTINILQSFLDLMDEEVNKDKNLKKISKEEIKYILLLVFYKIINKIREGYKVKVGTLFYIWIEKRDVRVNLPSASKRIIEDRLIPKLKLCRSFGYEVFKSINKDNEAILTYYKEKLERFLLLLKLKRS